MGPNFAFLGSFSGDSYLVHTFPEVPNPHQLPSLCSLSELLRVLSSYLATQPVHSPASAFTCLACHLCNALDLIWTVPFVSSY